MIRKINLSNLQTKQLKNQNENSNQLDIKKDR